MTGRGIDQNPAAPSDPTLYEPLLRSATDYAARRNTGPARSVMTTLARGLFWSGRKNISKPGWARSCGFMLTPHSGQKREVEPTWT